MFRRMTLILVRFLMIGFIFYISNRFLNTLKQGSGVNGVYLFIFSNYVLRIIAFFTSGIIFLIKSRFLPALKSEVIPVFTISILVLLIIPFFMTGTFFVFYGKTLEFSSNIAAFIAGCCTILLLSSSKK